MKRIFLAASLAVVLPSAARPDQDPEPAQPGDRIRVTCPTLSPRPVIGTLVSTSEKELVVEQAAGPVSLRREAVVALEKSLGRRPRRGTRIGGAILGGLVGVTLAMLSVGPCPLICAIDPASPGRCLNTCGNPSADGILGTAAGAAAGFAVGSLFKHERWQPASHTALRVEAAPTRGGARLSFSLRF